MKRKKEMISITVGQEVHNAFREYSLKKVDFSHSYNKKIKMRFASLFFVV